jgi:sec-independent protein translocase protein TatA
VLVIALLVLGPKRLPEVGRALGNGLRDFKSAINGEDDHRPEVTDAPGFENYRAESLGDEIHDPTVAPVDDNPTLRQTTSVTSPGEPALPAHPEDASAAAAQPLNSVVSKLSAEPTERLG